MTADLLIDADYIVYKCAAAAEEDFDFGDDVIVVCSRFSEAYELVLRDLSKIVNAEIICDIRKIPQNHFISFRES